MKNIAIRRLRVISVPKGEGISPKHKLVLLAELARMGIRISNPEYLDHVADTFFLDYHGALQTIKEMRGGDVDYVPLFTSFPDEVPDDDAYFTKRLLGYLGNVFELFQEGTRLENGMVIPDWLFDLQQFGADPITQMQSKSLWERAKQRIAKRKADEHHEWLDMELVWEDQVAERLRLWLEACIYAKSSIKEALHPDIGQLLLYFGTSWIDFAQIAMKENQALVLRILWQGGQEQAATELAQTPTDILRLFAALTGTDVSLSNAIKFPKMTRKQRRLVLAALDRAPSLAEDLRRYRGLWLELGRYVHPGEYRRRYAKAAEAFDALRNGRITTFNSRTESLLRGSEVGEVLMHLTKRPGVLARKCHELLRRFPQGSGMIVDAFATVAKGMTVKNLLVLRSYFATINDEDYRTIINKRGKIKVLPNNAKAALRADVIDMVLDMIDSALTKSLGGRDSWAGKSVWIDPELDPDDAPPDTQREVAAARCRGHMRPVAVQPPQEPIGGVERAGLEALVDPALGQ